MRRMGWVVLAVLVLVAGCDSQEYGQCAPPDDALQVLFKPKNPAHPFSHSFCVVCNPDIEEGEYASWAEDMGGSGDIGEVDGLHPCLYVYGDGENIDSFEACQSRVCDGGAIYSDMVSKSNGNIDVTPILNPDGSVTHEWVIVESGAELAEPAPPEVMPGQPAMTHVP